MCCEEELGANVANDAEGIAPQVRQSERDGGGGGGGGWEHADVSGGKLALRVCRWRPGFPGQGKACLMSPARKRIIKKIYFNTK